MKLKICHIIPNLIQSGTVKQMSLLARHLDNHQFETHVVVLDHSGPIESQLMQAGVCVHQVRMRKVLEPLALARLIRILQSLSPQIVHTWQLAGNKLGRVAARLARIPIVVASKRSIDTSNSLVSQRIDKWLARFTTCFSTNSNSIVDFCSAHGVPRQKFCVIPDAILPTGRPLNRDDVLERLGLSPRPFVVGIVGKLFPQKGHLDLIWAAELLRVALRDHRNPRSNVWVVIIGDGPEREHLQRYRDKCGSQDVVRFAGHREDAQELISGIDVLWNGSLFESQNNAIMEAMAAGVPVVAADIPGNRDLIADSQTGFLYQPGNTGQLARITFNLLLDQQQRSRVGMNAQQELRNQLKLDDMVGAYRRLYSDLWSQSSKANKGAGRFDR